MNTNKLLLLLSSVMLAYGCATMDKNECYLADWQAVGFEDGSRGYDSGHRFSQHRKACAKHGVSADFANYNTGHGRGVRAYCTAELGFRLGKVNRGIPSVCSGDLVQKVRLGYDFGHDIYLDKQELNKEVISLNAEIKILDDEIATLETEKQEHQKYFNIADTGLVNPQSTDIEKVLFYTQRDKMKKLIQEKEDEIAILEAAKEPYLRSISHLQRDIEDLDSISMPRSLR